MSRQPPGVGALRNVDDEGFMQGHELGVGDALGGASLGDTRRGGKKSCFFKGEHTAQMGSAGSCLFCSWLRSPVLPRTPGTACRMFHFLPLAGQSQVCAWWGRGGEEQGTGVKTA